MPNLCCSSAYTEGRGKRRPHFKQSSYTVTNPSGGAQALSSDRGTARRTELGIKNFLEISLILGASRHDGNWETLPQCRKLGYITLTDKEIAEFTPKHSRTEEEGGHEATAGEPDGDTSRLSLTQEEEAMVTYLKVMGMLEITARPATENFDDNKQCSREIVKNSSVFREIV